MKTLAQIRREVEAQVENEYRKKSLALVIIAIGGTVLSLIPFI